MYVSVGLHRPGDANAGAAQLRQGDALLLQPRLHGKGHIIQNVAAALLAPCRHLPLVQKLSLHGEKSAFYCGSSHINSCTVFLHILANPFSLFPHFRRRLSSFPALPIMTLVRSEP